MDRYINLVTLCFILSWLIPFTGLQAFRGAYRHYIFYIECATSFFMAYELFREILIVFYHVEMSVDALRVWLYGTEHIFLGIVIREVLLYVEKCQKVRRRSRRLS